MIIVVFFLLHSYSEIDTVLDVVNTISYKDTNILSRFV